MDIRRIEYFIRVAETLNFSEAAKKLHFPIRRCPGRSRSWNRRPECGCWNVPPPGYR